MKEPVVTNSTCLISLERIGQLDLLPALFEPVAKRLGVRIIGTVGILVRAKKQGILASIRPQLEALKNVGFRITPELEQEALRLANE